MPTWLAGLLAVLAGAGLSAQIAVNVHLRQGAGHPAIAAFISFQVGALILLAALLATRLPWPSLADLARVPFWAWGGGLLGAYYVFSTIALAPRLGAALFVVLVIGGQLTTALAIDQLGLLGAKGPPLDAWRLAGAALVVAGVVLLNRTGA
ncbi:MAG: family transporter [Cyanobacteria bacterium RYN_339]|nr:family transporter [Cyanobacteria bacterium RYN_339]